MVTVTGFKERKKYIPTRAISVNENHQHAHG